MLYDGWTPAQIRGLMGESLNAPFGARCFMTREQAEKLMAKYALS